jgi:amino acid adenylation domain-containing protein
MNAQSKDIQVLLQRLRESEIQLWVENGQLKYKAVPGKFNAELKQLVSSHKQAIIEWLVDVAETKNANKRLLIPKAANSESLGYPLSFSQQRLWFMHQYQPEIASYHCPVVIPLQDFNDFPALQQALSAICNKHSSLRTAFKLVGKAPRQFVIDHAALPFCQHDCRLWSGAEIEAHANQFFSQPFDLQNPPLFRAGLYSLPDGQNYLLLCFHHIVTDGWSMAIFRRDLLAALQDHEKFMDDKLDLEYVDYAVWNEQYLQQEVIPFSLEYWKNHLKNSPTESEFPTDFPRQKIRATAGRIYKRKLGETTAGAIVTKSLRQFLAGKGLTLYMLGLTAYSIVLSRFSRQQDVVIGTPVANRPHSQLQNMMGFFVNTLAIRCQPNFSLSIEDYLEQVKANCLQHLVHQELPFEMLVEALSLPRDQSRTPLVQTMFAVQNANQGEDLHQHLNGNPFNIDSIGTKFDINISLFEQGEDIFFECEYDTRLYSHQTIEHIGSAFEHVLLQIVENPPARIAEISLLDRSQQLQVLRTCSGEQQVYAETPNLALAFARTAHQFPDQIALEFQETCLSYRQLLGSVESLAAVLVEKKIRPGDVVPLLMDRSLDLVIAIFAVMRVGAAYLPIDVENPKARIEFVLGDSAARVAIVSAPYLDKIPDGVNGQILDVIASNKDSFVVTDVITITGLPDLIDLDVQLPAYVIYTSGSTGNPKGVINHHAALFNRIAWMQKNYPLSIEDRVLQKTNYAFDVSVWEFVWPLTYGATLVVAEPHAHKIPAHIVETITRAHITVLHFVPSMFQLFLQESIADLSSLKAIFCSGEALSRDLTEKFYTNKLNCKLFNLYGPTEAAIDVTSWDCADASAMSASIPIGRAIDNTAIYILDEAQHLLPSGVAGEIYIGGIGLATGYLNRPDLTAKSFLPDPFSAIPGRMYRTGDLGRYLPDGAVEYLGRIDFQVKVRGQRIEIEEIEAQLLKVAGVSGVAVVVAETKAGQQHLVAYYTGEAAGADLRVHLTNSLAHYMVPGFFVKVGSLPLGHTGKLDRKNLAGRGVPVVAVVEDRGEVSATELQLRLIWLDVLGVENAGINQNFFELGGTSLLMVQVHRQITNVFQLDISMVKLFSFPTIKELAGYIDGNSSASSSVEAIATLKVGTKRLATMRDRRKKLLTN